MPESKHRRKRGARRTSRAADWSGPATKHGPFGLFSNIKLFYFLGALIMVGSLAVGGICALPQGQTAEPTPTPEPTAEVTAEGAVTPEETPVAKKWYPAPPPMTIDVAKSYTAIVKTDKGDFSIELFDDQAPNTVNNFVFLARDGFYDGLTFHYVKPDFSVMTGDPSGAGTGGPGYNIAKEETPHRFEAGTVGMVNGSIFFVALTESKKFETGEFWAFGRVDEEGLKVVRQLAVGDTVLGVEIIEQ
ncbi:MAG: peptidylprolyl isomerase [Dehalococcoidia bacterium]|nr:peptidylprolyl isomerase [Dehalococcoidia bacterium]